MILLGVEIGFEIYPTDSKVFPGRGEMWFIATSQLFISETMACSYTHASLIYIGKKGEKWQSRRPVLCIDTSLGIPLTEIFPQTGMNIYVQ